MYLRLILRVRPIVLVLMLLLSVTVAVAVPAYPGTVSVEQEDGTTLDIVLHGDEYFGWRATTSGSPISEKGGHYYYVRYLNSGEIEYSSQRVSVAGREQSPPSGFNQDRAAVSAIASRVAASTRATRGANTASTRVASSSSARVNGLPVTASSFPTQGEARSIVLLLEFSDVSFSLLSPNSTFSNMLNMEGYSASGASGSARDYFLDNSGGVFDCQFDVYGPYTLPNSVSYYGKNDSTGFDSNPQQMVTDGATLAMNDGVDFSQYDLDGDGVVDNIFIFYAGYNEAEGASENTIWPHKWEVVTGSSYNGKRLSVYACTSELTGVTGTTIAGIGTFCHEFSHVFGLADHYDTDGSTNGYSMGLYSFDLMSYGSYNNSGRTPPLYNALELMMLGWSSPLYYSESGDITQQPITSGEFYRVDTDTDDEFFLLENRNSNASKWDEYLPSEGLLITHIDMSSNYLHLWGTSYNNPNGDTSHECFRIIPANNVDLNSTYNLNTGMWSNLQYWSDVTYPSSRGNKSWDNSSAPLAAGWSGESLAFGLSSITRSGSNIAYSVEAYCYYVTVWQWEALIGWYDDSYDSYRLVVNSSSGAQFGEYFTSDQSVMVEEMESGASYTFTIYGIDTDGLEELITEGSMQTLTKSRDIPTIALSKYEYSFGSSIYLKAINLDKSDTLSWYVDGVAVSGGLYTPLDGEHVIKCVVDRGADSYIIIKEISVK